MGWPLAIHGAVRERSRALFPVSSAVLRHLRACITAAAVAWPIRVEHRQLLPHVPCHSHIAPTLRPYRNSIFLFLLPILLQSIFCYQYNVVVCYIFIFAFTLMERGKGLWAVLLIMLSACTKVYGIVELALLLCYPKAWRNFGFAILCGAAMLALPILPALANGAAATAAGGPGEWVISLYSQMVDISNTHHNAVDYVGLLFARGLKPLLLPNYRLVQVCVLAVLAVIFFAMHRRWKDLRFRIQALAALTGYIILFSDCPETHTYIIAMPFWLMAFWLQPRHTWIDWTLFWLVFVNFSILPTDVLCPLRCMTSSTRPSGSTSIPSPSVGS